MSSKKHNKKMPLFFRLYTNTLKISEQVAPFIAKRMAVRAFFTPFRFKIPEKEQAFQTKAKKIPFELNGLSLLGYEWGKGEKTVLIMHGWSSRCSQLYQLIAAFEKKGFRCVGFDAPGHGNSKGNFAHVPLFSESLSTFVKLIGGVDYIVAHSMGGTASLLSIENGMQVKKLCIIATPTITADILEVSRQRMQASNKTIAKLRAYILERFGADLEEFTAAFIAKRMKQHPPTLLIYDKDDVDAPYHHLAVMQEAMPNANSFSTEKLGHTKILKSELVIEKVLEYLSN